MVQFVTAYSENAVVRAKLYPLFEHVFGISVALLQDFHRRGFWDPSYCPYTFFDGDTAVANASRFELPVMVSGRSILAAGIQSVMTLPAYRHRGLMSRLVERLLADVDTRYPLSLLFTENPTLYQKFGFHVIPEVRFRASVTELAPDAHSPLRRLDPAQPADAALLADRLQRATPLSYRFSPTAFASSFHLNCYDDTWHDRLYYHPDWNAVLIVDRTPDTVWLYGILAEDLPPMAEIVPALGLAPLSWVVTDFSPDRFPDVEWSVIAHESAGKLMARGAVELPITIKYPDIAKF